MYHAGPWNMSPRTWHEAGLFTCEDSSFNTKLSRKVLTSTFDKQKDECREDTTSNSLQVYTTPTSCILSRAPKSRWDRFLDLISQL